MPDTVLRLFVLAAIALLPLHLEAQDLQTPLNLPVAVSGVLPAENEEPFVVEIRTRTATDRERERSGTTTAAPHHGRRVGAFFVQGAELSPPELVALLRQRLGPAHPANRETTDARRSRHAVLIRCDRETAFDYAALVLEMCSDPDVAIRRVRFALADELVLALDQPVCTPETAKAEAPALALHIWQAAAKADPRPVQRRNTRIAVDRRRLPGAPWASETRRALHASIDAARSKGADRPARILVDPGVPLQRVIDLVDLLRAGMQRRLEIDSPPRLDFGATRLRALQDALLRGQHAVPDFPIASPGAATAKTDSRRRTRRRVPRPRRPRVPIDADLAWLARTQSDDGSWYSADETDAETLGTTALALLAFTAAGETHLNGRYKRNVRRASDWIAAAQSANGRYAEDPTADVLAHLAMVECYGNTMSPRFKPAAQRGQAHLARAIAWRAQHAPLSKVELPWIGWALLALDSGVRAGLKGAPEARSILAKLLVPLQPAGIEPEMKDPAASNLASLALLAAWFETPDDDARARLRTRICAFLKPRRPLDDQPDPQRWFFQTVLVSRSDLRWRSQDQFWRDWARALKPVVIDTQNRDLESSDCGSWRPAGENVSRTRTTTLMALCSMAYYRYGRVVGTQR